MKDCLTQCNGACCRFMLIEIAEKVNREWIDWFNLHVGFINRDKFEIVRLEDRYFIRMNFPCGALYGENNNLCTLADSKPQMCKDYHCEDERFSHVKNLV